MWNLASDFVLPDRLNASYIGEDGKSMTSNVT